MHTPRPFFQFLFRIHFFLVFAFFFLYLGFGFFLGPDFFVSDIGKKIRVIGADIVSVSAVVLGPPLQPVVSATPVCISGSPRIALDWSNDAATTTWDIDRDGSPLITGLSASQYSDISVSGSTSYTYIVTAHGPMFPGTAISDPLNASTLSCSNVVSPTVLVTRFNQKDISASRTHLSASDRTPFISGTTNIPNALIDISVYGPMSIAARISANVNGYWEWTSPIKLSRGDHQFSLIATDPLDNSRTATDAFSFEITDDSDGEGASSRRKQDQEETSSLSLKPVENIGQLFDFTLQFIGGQQSFVQGSDMSFDVYMSQGDQSSFQETVFSYTILDPSGKEIFRSSVEKWDASKRVFQKTLPLPMYYNPQKGYRIRVDAQRENYLVSREIFFEVLPFPVVQLNTGEVITYSEIGGLLGWVLLFLMTIFFLWLLLFFREYWFFVHSLRRVTERHLERLGFFGPGRGVWG